MEFFDVINERRSVRKFQNKKIENEKMQKILEACNAAPSAGNCQAYEIVVIRDEKIKKELFAASAYRQHFLVEAPVLLVFCANEKRNHQYGERGKNLYSVQDATIACTFAMLAATDLGLASVWVGAFDENAVADAIGVENKHIKPVAILPIGYADEKPRKTTRRNLDDLVHKESF